MKWECRKAKREHERAIAKEAKENPKAFYKYARSKLKVNATVGDLKKANGSLAQNDKDKANTLNSFFASVFTKEDTSSIPDFQDRPFNTTLNKLDFTSKDIHKNYRT